MLKDRLSVAVLKTVHTKILLVCMLTPRRQRHGDPAAFRWGRARGVLSQRAPAACRFPSAAGFSVVWSASCRERCPSSAVSDYVHGLTEAHPG